jgi:uncharacterized protein (TIGR03000 family)
VTYVAPVVYDAPVYCGSVGSTVSYAPTYESTTYVQNWAPAATVYESPVYESAPIVTDDCCGGVVEGGVIEGDVMEGAVEESYDSDSSEVMPNGEARHGDTALLIVNVPENARVFVNGYETTSTGAVRQFLSSGLQRGKAYVYEVRAVVEATGEEIGETKVVRLTAGNRRELAFASLTQSDHADTVLTLRVPEGAEVELAGVQTKMTGTNRVYASQKLAAGESWNDYQVRVTLNGVTKEHTMTIRGGENHELAFEFPDSQLALR